MNDARDEPDWAQIVSRIARLSWPRYLLFSGLLAAAVGVVGGSVWSATGGSSGVVFGIALAVVLVGGFASGRGEIRTFFK